MSYGGIARHFLEDFRVLVNFGNKAYALVLSVYRFLFLFIVSGYNDTSRFLPSVLEGVQPIERIFCGSFRIIYAENSAHTAPSRC